MPRIRTVKPELFRHGDLYRAEQRTGLPLRLSFVGLFTVADREGRFKWRPDEVKLDVLPFDDIDFNLVLDALTDAGFIRKYSVGGKIYGVIPSFPQHQHINKREQMSNIPAPQNIGAHDEIEPETDDLDTPHVQDGASTCMHGNFRGERKGKEGKGKERKGKEQERKGKENSCFEQLDNPEPEIDDQEPDYSGEFLATEFDSWCADVLDAYNRTLAGPHDSPWDVVNAWGVADLQHLTLRYREDFRTRFQAVFDTALCSSFLRGGSRTAWVPNLNWFIKANNFQKILSGEYNDPPPRKEKHAVSVQNASGSPAEIPERFLDKLRRIEDPAERRDLARRLGVPDAAVPEYSGTD